MQPKHTHIDVDNVLVAGQHKASRARHGRGVAAGVNGCLQSRAEADLGSGYPGSTVGLLD